MTDSRKRCSWVHDTLCIDPRGDVYACCHQRPGIFGNIYRNTLREIFNGEQIKQFRQQEIDGKLPCLRHCTLPQKATVSDSVHGDYDTALRRIQVEFGEKCNIACIMCPQDHKSKLELDESIIVKNIDIPQSCEVMFFGGEPLVIKSARRFFDHCAASEAEISFLTNGTAISEEMAAKIARHCSMITISLNAASKEVHEVVNAGSQFEKVLRNIQRLVQAKKDLNGRVLIGGHMTIVEPNIHEIPQFIRKREEFGFEFIHFGFDMRTVPRMLAKDPALKARLATEIQAALDEAGKTPHGRGRVDAKRLSILGLV